LAEVDVSAASSDSLKKDTLALEEEARREE
jgi:hypothetical protein